MIGRSFSPLFPRSRPNQHRRGVLDILNFCRRQLSEVVDAGATARSWSGWARQAKVNASSSTLAGTCALHGGGTVTVADTRSLDFSLVPEERKS